MNEPSEQGHARKTLTLIRTVVRIYYRLGVPANKHGCDESRILNFESILNWYKKGNHTRDLSHTTINVCNIVNMRAALVLSIL